MKQDRWRSVIRVAVIASVLLGLATTGLGIEILHKTNDSSTQSNAGPLFVIVTPSSSGVTVSGVQSLVSTHVGGPPVTAVDFVATGGTLKDTQIALGRFSYYGWAASWNTTTVANGTYMIASISYTAAGQSARSSSISVTVKN